MCATSTLLLNVFLYYSFVFSKNIVGLRIRKARKEARITQMKLAAELQLLGIKIDRTSITKLESGIRPVTDIEIVAIAKILKVEVPQLFKDSDKLFGQLKIQ